MDISSFSLVVIALTFQGAALVKHIGYFGVAMLLPSIISASISIYENIMAPESMSSNLVRDASKSEFTERLGFMDVVRERLFRIGDYAENGYFHSQGIDW